MKKCMLLFFAASVTCVACRKNAAPAVAVNTPRFPVTEQEKEQVALIREVATILQEVYRDPDALREVNATIYSGFYDDERVLLRDLLLPESSSLYQQEKFKETKVKPGIFKMAFYQAWLKGHYPGLDRQLSLPHNLATDGTNSWWQLPLFNGSAKVLSPKDGLSIYFPYSGHFNGTTGDAFISSTIPTIVAADRDADVGAGQQAYRCGFSLCYKTVTVNDDYCESNPTHIVGAGAEQAPPKLSSVSDTSSAVKMVMLGMVRCTHQYDRLISFTGNGGGSELRFIRADGFLQQNANGQITSPQNTIAVNCSREEIRKKRWKTINSIWDSNWEPDNKEQVFGIYEEDNEGSQTFSGSIQTKLKSFTIEPIGYSITVKTKDDIIRQLNWNRQSFFAYNNGQLKNGCGANLGWTIYDCNTPVGYTLPLPMSEP